MTSHNMIKKYMMKVYVWKSYRYKNPRQIPDTPHSVYTGQSSAWPKSVPVKFYNCDT